MCLDFVSKQRLEFVLSLTLECLFSYNVCQMPNRPENSRRYKVVVPPLFKFIKQPVHNIPLLNFTVKLGFFSVVKTPRFTHKVNENP